MKVGTYARCSVYQVEGNRTFTLINSTEVDNTTATDKLTSTEVYKDVATAAIELRNQAYTAIVIATDGSTVSYANNAGSSSSCTGNAATATKLQTARKINGISFDGTQDITIVASGGNGDAAPIGSIITFPGSSIPTNYKICDGSLVKRSDYPELFAIIGTTYGAGDGTTTFALPNIKSRVIVGLNASETEFNSLGKTGGTKSITLSKENLPDYTLYSASHTHTQVAHSHTLSNVKGTGTVSVNTDYGNSRANVLNSSSLSGTTTDSATPTINGTTITVTSGGSGTSFTNIQPYIVLNYIIKTGGGVNTSQVVNGLNSTSTTDALSANQGKVLSDKIDALAESIGNAQDNLDYATESDINGIFTEVFG